MGVKVREKEKDSGIWWVFINYKGRRSSRQVGTKKAAEKVKEHIEARLKLGQDALPDQQPKKTIPTLTDYFDGLQKTHLAMAVRESTAGSYEMNFRVHILPELGALRLNEITRDRIKEFVGHLTKKEHSRTVKVKTTNVEGETVVEKKTITRPYSKITIRIILAELCAVLNHAKEDAHITENPSTRLSKFYKRAKIVHEEIQPLSADEVPLFLTAAKREAPQHYELFLTALHTGMRSGELAALRWTDLDEHGKFIRVHKNISHGKIGETKTGKARRVDVSDELLRALQELRRRRQAEYLARGKSEIPEWVFLSPGRLEKDKETGELKRAEGQRIDIRNVKNHAFFKCLAKAGLHRIRFHDLRHTYATLLLMQGESPAYVRDQLRHSSIKMTVDIYGHWIPGANRQAVNRLPGLCSPTPQSAVAVAAD